MKKNSMRLALSLSLTFGLAVPFLHVPTAQAASVNCSGILDSRSSYEISQVQGSGAASPLVGKSVTTCGTVYALESDGYWMQDTTGDGNAATSEGIFVYRSSGPGTIKVGDIARQSGTVKEYNGLTELSASGAPSKLGTGAVPAATELTAALTESSLEPLEGMRVVVKSATAVAGTTQYDETFVVPGATTARVSRTDANTPLFKIENVLGKPFPGASTFDTISGDPTGPLSYTFDAYSLLWNEGSIALADTGNTQNALPADTTANVTTATFNVENYFGVGSEVEPGDATTTVTQAQFDTKTAKISQAIRNSLGSPDIVALQEVENISVLNALAAKIAADGGPAYTGYLVEGNDGRGIDVAFLVKPGTTVQSVEQIGKTATTTLTGCGYTGTNELFGRPPLVLRVQTASGQNVAVINNHFKSRGGADPLNNEYSACRDAEATFVADAANSEAANGYNVIVTGDLNSYPEDNSVAILQESANLTDMISQIPADRAFSYIYNGRAQFLDHLLVSNALKTQAVGIDSAKIDPDHPFALESDATNPLRISDHDPMRITY